MLEALEFVERAFAGWRFLFSRSYREQTLARWSQQRQMETMQEVVGSFLGMAFTILVPLLVWAGLR
jgi:hypothetical protein